MRFDVKYKKHELKDVTRSQLIFVIDEYIVGFKAERNKEILKRRLCDGLTYEELAEEFDMSVMQMKNIIYRNMEVIVKYLRVEV